MSGDEFARDLRRDGVDYEHLRAGGGFGTGLHAKFLEAIWSDNPMETLAIEAAEFPPRPQIFETKWGDQRRGKVADRVQISRNPFKTHK
jgi:hypothetical protein